MESKQIKSIAESVNSVTHSYTIMSTISKNGKLILSLFIAFPEQTGKLRYIQKGFFRQEIFTLLLLIHEKLVMNYK